MFTGIIEERGRVHSLSPNSEGMKIEVNASKVLLSTLKIGDSVAVNGVCLTAVTINTDRNLFSADIVRETLEKTALKSLAPNHPVNLERPLLYNGRIDGHLVQGHVDGVGIITRKMALTDGSWEIVVSASPEQLRFVVEKGSIAVDGTSLTVVSVNDHSFSFSMIPHTAEVTVLGVKRVGDCVNLEVDILAKYMEKLTVPYKTTPLEAL